MAILTWMRPQKEAFNNAKVDEIKRLISQGCYDANPSLAAEKMLKENQSLLHVGANE